MTKLKKMKFEDVIASMGISDWIRVAKSMTAKYAKNHKGRNKLEKECLEKGYLIKKLGEMSPDCREDEKNKLVIFALEKMPWGSWHRSNFVPLTSIEGGYPGKAGNRLE